MSCKALLRNVDVSFIDGRGQAAAKKGKSSAGKALGRGSSEQTSLIQCSFGAPVALSTMNQLQKSVMLHRITFLPTKKFEETF